MAMPTTGTTLHQIRVYAHTSRTHVNAAAEARQMAGFVLAVMTIVIRLQTSFEPDLKHSICSIYGCTGTAVSISSLSMLLYPPADGKQSMSRQASACRMPRACYQAYSLHRMMGCCFSSQCSRLCRCLQQPPASCIAEVLLPSVYCSCFGIKFTGNLLVQCAVPCASIC